MFKLPPLPYPENALEPTISATTMATHYGKHHATYVKNLNAALAEKKDAPASLEEIVRMAAKEKGPFFNNAAQTWNHAFFWNAMSPQAQRPDDDLKTALDRDFKSYQGFHDEFVDAGLKQFGSGWAWLVSDAKGALTIQKTHDAELPTVDPGLTPLLVCDVWEHAYYLDYKNDRGAFLKAYVEKLANWRFAEAQYAAAKNGGKGAWVFPTS
jgi:Fe-Mn family superoxide dismutase